ncbi:DEAD/DEAH box helicase [Natribaculum luteum]|uniref:DEAD/DEAH box helicase n=1 Tax=Natribaculum luteum TaxID=1586232 RepID=A0ABD5P2P5_9EURY|nr:hypothetical protein [Natribaculum luteum]
MSKSSYDIPDRIETADHKYLNCRIGENVRPDNENTQRVLNNIEEALSEQFLQLYYKYPQTGRGDAEYIDVVGLASSVGAFVMNIVDIEIDDIERLTGPDWQLAGESTSIRPENTVGDAMIAVRRQFENRDELRTDDRQSKIPVSDFVVLPNITRRKWHETFEDKASERLIFKDTLANREELKDKLTALLESPLDDEILRHGLATLKFSDSISGGQLNAAITPKSKRELLDFLDRRLKILTDKQLKIGLQTPDAPQHIRGIAGSGKTVVCALRAAKLHWEHPKWTIAVAFRTHGLRQSHEELIAAFYQNFSGGDDPNWSQLHVRHGWGGRSTGPGMYYEIARESGESPLSYDDAKRKFGRYTKTPKLLDKCCRNLIETGEIEELYDTIIIDEAQDLTPHFFRMCYAALSEPKRIYWAYDEAQNLASLEALSAVDLFGVDENGNPRVSVSGKLPGGINSTHIMRKSFRTPRSILMTAHAFGMGLYRDGPVIQTLTTQEGWDRLGYEVTDGDFKQSSVGERVVIKRPVDNSPHPFWELQEPSELLRLYWGKNWKDEINWVIDDIEQNLEEENVLPHEIMITHLWPYKKRQDPLDQLKAGLEERLGGLQENRDSIVHHVTETVSQQGRRANFKEKGKVTISEVHHARGNEAGLVYVMGLDSVAEEVSKDVSDSNWRRQHLRSRNKAFVALTRTQGWCRLTGTDPTSKIAGELNRVVNDTRSTDPKLQFNVPDDDGPFKSMDLVDYSDD